MPELSVIINDLFSMQDADYKDFHSALMPTVDKNTIIGIRVPVLRKYARKLYKTNDFWDFLSLLPHKYYEENNLHAFLIEQITDVDRCIFELERFLPYINNWATCDMLSPKVFKKDPEKALERALIYMYSADTYTVRFGIKLLMDHFLDERFDVGLAERIAAIRSTEYYINMMIGWYFATALAKQYEKVLPIIKEKKLSDQAHSIAIRKACESYRLSDTQKQELKGFRLKVHR